MSTVSVRYKLYWEGGKGYQPYFKDPGVTFVGGIRPEETIPQGWYYGYLTAVDPQHWIDTMSKFFMELADQPLDVLKAAKIKEIDEKTVKLLATGFTYDGLQFPLTDQSQINWVSLGMAQSLLLLKFPLLIFTVDYKEYELVDDKQLLAFLDSYVQYNTTAASITVKGEILKKRVAAATTAAEIKAIIDDR